MTSEPDYTHRSRTAVFALIAALILLSFVPPQTVGGIRLKRANILSEFLRFEEEEETRSEEAILTALDEEEFRIDLLQVARLIADSAPREVPATYEWSLIEREPAPAAHRALPGDTARRLPELIPIEDFDTTGHSRLAALCRKLQRGDSLVRIAVMGDSFIEGDILTSDLREQLQLRYGGGGAGFAPAASPLTDFRRTIRTRSKGWNSYNVMQRRTTPEALADSYYVSGWVCQPADGASTRWEGTSERACLDSCNTARILFLSRSDSRVEVTVNDAQSRIFEIEASPLMRQIVVRGTIRSLEFSVLSGAAGVVGYGALFESSPGVAVDNYSIRSNNGQAMFRTSPALNAQADRMLGYDLVILQYGLNILQPDVRNYTRYGEQIEKMIAYVRHCFPRAAVLVMSVSDRSVKEEERFVPMASAPFMVEAQRAAAEASGAAFWNTYRAMQSLGGMERFVAEGWAGKDYTHINFAGGRRIAWGLCDAIDDAVRRHPLSVRVAHANIADSARITPLEEALIRSARPVGRNLRNHPER
ncbi:MAG: hypothetical protein K2H69_04040 [Alistipes sp.]|nr:hypothetical protein [Alistipes sp.]